MAQKFLEEIPPSLMLWVFILVIWSRVYKFDTWSMDGVSSYIQPLAIRMPSPLPSECLAFLNPSAMPSIPPFKSVCALHWRECHVSGCLAQCFPKALSGSTHWQGRALMLLLQACKFVLSASRWCPIEINLDQVWLYFSGARTTFPRIQRTRWMF